MPCLFGLLIAMAIGILAIWGMPWLGRFHTATKRQDPHLERWLTAAARPTTQEASARANASLDEPQWLEVESQHDGDPGLLVYDVAGVESRECARACGSEAPERTVSTVPLSLDGAQCWMTAHDLTAAGLPASESSHREDNAWKVITFVCHMPRLSMEERQHLLATWGNGHHGG